MTAEELDQIGAQAIERGANTSKRGQTVAINAHKALELVQMARKYQWLLAENAKDGDEGLFIGFRSDYEDAFRLLSPDMAIESAMEESANLLNQITQGQAHDELKLEKIDIPRIVDATIGGLEMAKDACMELARSYHAAEALGQGNGAESCASNIGYLIDKLRGNAA